MIYYCCSMLKSFQISFKLDFWGTFVNHVYCSQGQGSSPRTLGRTTRGRKGRNVEEETEESSATDTDKNSKAAKEKNKADSEAEGTPVRRGRRKGKGQLTDSESESPKEVGKRLTRSGVKESSDSDASPQKGKKGGRKGKGKVEEVEESGKGKGRGKKTKVEDSESEDDVPLVDIKKNKDSPMGKSKNKEEGNDTVQKVPQTPVQKIAQEKNSDDSPRSIFKMFESGLIQEGEQENLQASQQPVVSSLVTEVLELPITSGKNVGQSEDTSIVSDSAAPSSEIGVDDSVQSEVLTLECESKVEEVNYEDFITSMGEGSKPDPKVIVKKDTAEASDSKTGKPVRKKTKKSEEIKVDKSMLDLFKPDVDVSNKRKGSVNSGKKEGLPSATEAAKSGEKTNDSKRKQSDSDKNSSHKVSDSSKVKKDTGSDKNRSKDSDLSSQDKSRHNSESSSHDKARRDSESSSHGKVRRDSEKEKAKKDFKKSDSNSKVVKDKGDNTNKKGSKEGKVRTEKDEKKKKLLAEKGSVNNGNSNSVSDDSKKKDEKKDPSNVKIEGGTEENLSSEVENSTKSESVDMNVKDSVQDQQSLVEPKVETKEDLKQVQVNETDVPENNTDKNEEAQIKESGPENLKEEIPEKEVISENKIGKIEETPKAEEVKAEPKVTPGGRGQRKAKLKFLNEKLPEMTEKEKRPIKKKQIKEKKVTAEEAAKEKEEDSGKVPHFFHILS